MNTFLFWLLLGLIGGFAGRAWYDMSHGSKIQSIIVAISVSVVAAAFFDLVFGFRP